MYRTTTILAITGSVGLFLACGGTPDPAPTTPGAATDAQTLATPKAAPETPAETAPEAALDQAAEPAPAEATPAQAAPTAPAPEAATAAPAAPADDFKGKGPDKTEIHSAKSKKAGTPFDHWGHQKTEIKCGKCHHYGKKTCGGSGCHLRVEKDAPTKKAAYHDRCIPCHKRKKIHNGCGDCHPKAG